MHVCLGDVPTQQVHLYIIYQKQPMLSERNLFDIHMIYKFFHSTSSRPVYL